MSNWTKEEMKEFEAFDYAGLFEELGSDDLDLELPEEPKQVYHKVVTIDVSGAMEIHLNRLEQLKEEESVEYTTTFKEPYFDAHSLNEEK